VSLVTFVPYPEGSNPSGVINTGSGSFDIGAALTAGDGLIQVDPYAQNLLYEALLDFPGLVVFGSPGPGGVTPSVADVIEPFMIHTKNAQPGKFVTYGQDGVGQWDDPPVIGVPEGTPANQVPITDNNGGFTFSPLASVSGAVPNPDTFDGSAGASGEVVDAAHSHPRSLLYDGHGQDDVNVVAESGIAVSLPDPAEFQSSLVTLTGDCSFLLPDAALGKRFTLALKQDATGNRVPSFPGNVSWPGGALPTWSTTPNDLDLVTFECLDGVNWYCLFPPMLSAALPATPMTVVQRADVTNFATTNFENPVTPGNAILFFRQFAQSGPPSGGGCTNWTSLVEVGSDVFDVWLATDSVGGDGSQALSTSQALWGVFLEVAGVNASISDAYSAVQTDLGATVTSDPYVTYTTDAIEAEEAGDAPFTFIFGFNSFPKPDGEGFTTEPTPNTDFELAVPADWALVTDIFNYQGTPVTAPVLLYKTNSTAGETCQATVVYQDGRGRPYTPSCYSFFLRP
jgi:hypothetical protein